MGARAIESVREAGLAQSTPVLVLPLEPWPPADADGVLGPDLSSEAVADAKKPIASGIRFDSNALFDCRFAPPASCAPELALLARIAASYTALSNIDGCLWHAPARSSVLRALSSEERTVYLNRLADGFHAVMTAESRFAATPDSHNAFNLLDLWIDLDESFHSLVPLPVCADSSWWSRIKNAARGPCSRASIASGPAAWSWRWHIACSKGHTRLSACNRLVISDYQGPGGWSGGWLPSRLR